MTEKEITEKLRTCIENAFGYCLDEVGECEDEDGEMFFSDGYFYVVLRDGSLCQTTYTADDFKMIRFRRGDEEAGIEGYVVIYMNNGERLFYYGYEWSDYCGTTWMIPRVGRGNCALHDDAFIEFFEKRRDAEVRAKLISIPQDVEIIEYEEDYEERVKDLLVELQTYLSSLDEREVIVLKENYREDYFDHIMREIEKHEGKMFLARNSEGIIGLATCKILEDSEERELTTSCPKSGFISDLVVAKNERGKGIGAALLTAADKFFAEHECDYIQLEVFEPNTDARRLYEEYGFKTNCRYLSKKV